MATRLSRGPENVQPAAGGWHRAAPLNVARAGAAGAELGGAVYVAGGWTDTSFQTALADVETLGDSPGARWQRLPSMPTARGNPAGAALAGRVYVVGGYPPAGQAFDVVEIYEPSRNAWSSVAPLPAPRGAAGAAAAGDRLYVAGGDDGTTTAVPLASMVSYDPETGSWQPEPPMPTARSLLKMVELNGDIYAIGGVAVGPFLATVERYDPRQRKWQQVAAMSTGRGNPGVAVAGNRIVVVGGAGGALGSAQPLTSSEVYDPRTGRWQVLHAQLHPGRASLTSALAHPDTILAIGGFDAPGPAISPATSRVDALQIAPVTDTSAG
jgi:N-acetylneuraminic acid mutarotase